MSSGPAVAENRGVRRYQVLHPIGRGGFGTVYRANLLGDAGFVKPVALKVLNPEFSGRSDLAERLRDEARMLGLLQHRAVVHVDSLVQLEGNWTVVMEYVHGVDLSVAAAAGALPPRAALEIAAEVASALHVAWTTRRPDHQPLCLIHRDIKPGNIIVTATGGVKVLDFGIARAEFHEREARTGDMAPGTPGFLAPERLEGVNGPEADIYALGATLYDLLVGRAAPWASIRPERHAEVVSIVRGDLAPVAGAGLSELVARMLSFKASDRPTARQLDEEIHALLPFVQGERLRVWAERTVPALLADRALPPRDSISGQVLVENPGGPSTPAPITQDEHIAAAPLTEPPAPGRRWSWILPALGLGAAALGALLLQRPTGCQPSARSADPVVQTPTPGDDPLPPDSTDGAGGDQDTGETEDAPAESPPIDEAAGGKGSGGAGGVTPPPRPAPKDSKVVVEKDQDFSVSLRDLSSGATLAPGHVPPGSYRVEVTEPGRAAARWGQITVAEGETVTLVCKSFFHRCTVQK